MLDSLLLKANKLNHPQRRATPQARRGKRLTIIVREAPHFEEAPAVRAGRLFLAAGAVLNNLEMLGVKVNMCGLEWL